MSENTFDMKEKIISVFKKRGPSLPIHVSQETGLSILFSSAFLSELLNEKRLKISDMKVGNTPIYFIPGQEFMLERFSDYLKNKEKEAFVLLKDGKILKDNEQQPAIRVALRELKDFAVPFRISGKEEIYWKYFSISADKLKDFVEKEKILKESVKPFMEKELSSIEEEIKIEKEKPKEKIKKIRKKLSKTRNVKQNEKFLEKVKDFLMKSSIEINSIESIGKNEIVLKIKDKGDEKLLFAYNKKRITEKEIVKAGKKASEENLRYSIFFLGTLPKKITDFAEAIKNMDDVEKLE